MKYNLNVLKRWYLPWRYPSNWLKNIRHFFKSWKWAYQRVVRGYADCDVWNLDLYYSSIITGTLRKLAGSTISYPPGLIKKIYGPTDEEFAFQAWKDYMNEIADHIDAAEAYDAEDTKAADEKGMEELKVAFDMLLVAYRDLWD